MLWLLEGLLFYFRRSSRLTEREWQFEIRNRNSLVLRIGEHPSLASEVRRVLTINERWIFGDEWLNPESLANFIRESNHPAYHLERLLSVCRSIKDDIVESDNVIEIEQSN